MLIDSDPDMIDTVYTFCESVGLPTTLAEIGLIDVNDDDLIKATNAERFRRKKHQKFYSDYVI